MLPVRTRILSDAPVRVDGDYVLYWMTSARRAHHNFALSRAVEVALELNKPLLVFEALRIDYPWASARFHQFVVEGMLDNRAAFAGVAHYLAYVEPKKNAGKGLLETLARSACVLLTDDFPAFFLPQMVEKTAAKLPGVRFEVIDSNGILPMRLSTQPFGYAHAFRRFMQKHIAVELGRFPEVDPLLRLRALRQDHAARQVPSLIHAQRWIDDAMPLAVSSITTLAIDHSVTPVNDRGGSVEARARLDVFLQRRLPSYATARSHPDDECASGLSLWLHFGHISAHEIFLKVMHTVDWKRSALAAKPNGKREGFFGADANAEAFLDELIVWRELGYVRCALTDDWNRYEGLPDWSRASLEKHASDPRPYVYAFEQLELGETHDEVWNAAMRELRATGRIQNYLRMLWGKRVLEWSTHPKVAFETLIRLNDKYSVDGRNPNTYTNVAWIFGGYDRPWFPERPIFGNIRYMSSALTPKKLRMKRWLTRWGSSAQLSLGE